MYIGPLTEKGGIMKCLACGREMDNKGTHFDCPNILCDYEEEIEKVSKDAFSLRHVIPIMTLEMK